MTLQQLMVFLSVCEELNYSRAASHVYMTRQAVRQNIAELEKECRGALFQNSCNHLSLTEKGQLLRDKALPLMEAYRDLQHSMIADIRLEHPIRLGISASTVPDYLPGLQSHLASFSQLYPNLPVDAIRIENDEAGPALVSKAFEAAIVLDLGSNYPGVQRTELTSHPVAVLVGRTHPLFSRPRISLSDLNQGIFYLPGHGPEFSPLFEAADACGAEIDFTIMPSFYQVLYHISDFGGAALNRYNKGDHYDAIAVRNIPLEGVPPLCSSFLSVEAEPTSPVLLLRDWLIKKIQRKDSVL